MLTRLMLQCAAMSFNVLSHVSICLHVLLHAALPERSPQRHKQSYLRISSNTELKACRPGLIWAQLGYFLDVWIRGFRAWFWKALRGFKQEALSGKCERGKLNWALTTSVALLSCATHNVSIEGIRVIEPLARFMPNRTSDTSVSLNPRAKQNSASNTSVPFHPGAKRNWASNTSVSMNPHVCMYVYDAFPSDLYFASLGCKHSSTPTDTRRHSHTHASDALPIHVSKRFLFFIRRFGAIRKRRWKKRDPRGASSTKPNNWPRDPPGAVAPNRCFAKDILKKGAL